MTARDGSGPGPDVELLAELDAGLLAPGRAAEVGAAARRDPAATAVLAALAATRAELAALPVPALPSGSAERWTAALRAAVEAGGAAGGPTDPDGAAAEPRGGDLAVPTPAEEGTGRRPDGDPRRDHPTGRPRRRPRGPRRGPRLFVPARRSAVAAVLLGGLAAGLLWPRADPAPPDRVELAAAGRSALGATDLGGLADPVRRAGCLRALGVLGLDPAAPPIGGRRVDLARGPGVLLVFATGELGVFDVVVVDPDCGPSGGTLLGTARIGR
jgi:hypothetical protein